jgi:hypothetical protein
MSPAHLAAAQGYGELLAVLEAAARPDAAAAPAAEGWEGEVAAVGRCKLNPADLQLESARFQPLRL